MGLSKRARGTKQPVAFNPDEQGTSTEAPVAKKAKTAAEPEPVEGEDEPADTLAEVWEDAKELWEKAMEAAGGQSPI